MYIVYAVKRTAFSSTHHHRHHHTTREVTVLQQTFPGLSFGRSFGQPTQHRLHTHPHNGFTSLVLVGLLLLLRLLLMQPAPRVVGEEQQLRRRALGVAQIGTISARELQA